MPRSKPKKGAALRKVAKASGSIIISIIVFLIVIQLFGVPLRSLISGYTGSMLQTKREMDVKVDPTTPTFIGQKISIVVTEENHFPIQDARVSISQDGSKITDFYTNENGLVEIEYPGETTIIVVEKENYSSVMSVVPHIPDKWIIGIITAIFMGIGAFGSIVKYGDTIIKYISKNRKKKKLRTQSAKIETRKITKYPRSIWIAIGVATAAMISAIVAVRVDVAFAMAFLGIGYTAAFTAISILLSSEMEKRICDKIDEIRLAKKYRS